ncbi:hypothetical protein [Veronia pacifica]|uniref:HmuY protein n=1 Tax=Veronia pacifica TaxID=1080227 RepID=A0A1C3EMR4_9GAMM|nr:hypothetical protein [Veronia pacifica]ODA34515.1 hypothetical protein A8L45_05975 [Veronia pacifica]
MTYNIKQVSAAAVSALILMGCNGSGSSSSEQENNGNTEVGTVSVVDASTGQKQGLSLISGAVVTDDSWHVAYQKYVGFSTNGGASASGDGKVSGFIAHQYDELYDDKNQPVQAEFEKLDASSTADKFSEVTFATCSAGTYVEDSIKTQIEMEDWVEADYSQGAPTYSAKEGNGWIIKTDVDGSDTYALVSVKTLTVEFGQATTRKLEFSVKNWNENSQTFDNEVVTEVDFSSERQYFDINDSNVVMADNGGWDISIKAESRAYVMQVNGGASGSGKAGVGYLLNDKKASEITNPTDSEQVYKYFSDTATGVLSKPGSYGPLQYNVAGRHQMWPTFTTYCIKDEQGVVPRLFKVQVLGNYGKEGTEKSGNIVYRYEELTQ